MANIYDMADTWNDGLTAFTAIKMNVTDTASVAGSLLMDLQVGGVSQFRTAKNGDVNIGAGTSTNIYTSRSARSFSLSAGGVQSGGIRHISGSSLTILAGSSYSTTHVVNGVVQASGGYFGWNDGVYSFSNLTPDLILARDAANTLALRRSTNAQTFNIYNTYTDGSNYERGFMKWNSNVLEIGVEGAGTGNGSRNIAFRTGGGTPWRIVGTGGALEPIASNQRDIGTSSNRLKSVYVGTSVINYGYDELVEMTAPSAPAADRVRVFAEDDGSGNTRLMALFGTGSAKAFAGEDFQTVKSDTTQAGANTASINNIVTVTQAEYDLLTPDADTVYFITA